MPTLNLLILEDRPEDADLIKYVLTKDGFELSSVIVDTEKGFRASITSEVELILADYNLPQFTALQALKILQDLNVSIPFIVVTGTVSEEAAVQCIKHGATDYLIKDRLARLPQSVRHALEEKKLRDERDHIEQQMVNTQKLTDLGMLAAGIVHEINTPLQVITGLSASLKEKAINNQLELDNLISSLERINRNAWRCVDITRGLLSYAHSSTGETISQDMNVLVKDTLLLIEHQLHVWSNIEIVLDLEENIPTIQCDRNRIIQILINLLTNARDAMPNGGQIFIRTRYDQINGQICLEVEDTGAGIPEDLVQKIFSPFFTTKPAGIGTGLGLSIVSGIVEAYGGNIQVKSQIKHGSTFTISFPINGNPTIGHASPLN